MGHVKNKATHLFVIHGDNSSNKVPWASPRFICWRDMQVVQLRVTRAHKKTNINGNVGKTRYQSPKHGFSSRSMKYFQTNQWKCKNKALFHDLKESRRKNKSLFSPPDLDPHQIEGVDSVLTQKVILSVVSVFSCKLTDKLNITSSVEVIMSMCTQFTSDWCRDLSELRKLHLQVGEEHILNRLLGHARERELKENKQHGKIKSDIAILTNMNTDV